MADRVEVKTEIRRLVRAGDLLRRREVLHTAQPDEREKFLDKLSAADPDREALFKEPRFVVEYQRWYSEALRVVEQLLPDRYQEFRGLYRDDRRKGLDVETFGIADYIAKVQPVSGFNDKRTTVFRAMRCFERQINAASEIPVVS